jgi:hypothetical protein
MAWGDAAAAMMEEGFAGFSDPVGVAQGAVDMSLSTTMEEIVGADRMIRGCSLQAHRLTVVYYRPSLSEKGLLIKGVLRNIVW